MGVLLTALPHYRFAVLLDIFETEKK